LEGKGNAMKNFSGWLTATIFLGVGIWCLVGAKGMQKRAIEASDSMKINPFRSYIKSPYYLITTKITGISSIAVALLLLVLLIGGK